MSEHFGAAADDMIKAFKTKQKRIRSSKAARRLTTEWPALCQRISRVMLPVERISLALEEAGAPVKPADLGWDASAYEKAVLHARFSRERFTFLDLI